MGYPEIRIPLKLHNKTSTLERINETRYAIAGCLEHGRRVFYGDPTLVLPKFIVRKCRENEKRYYILQQGRTIEERASGRVWPPNNEGTDGK